MDAYFVGDDFGAIRLYSQKPPLHFLTLFTTPWTETIYGQWDDELRPFQALTYQINSLWGASSPVPYHATTLLIHLVTSILVFVMARAVAGTTFLGSTFAGVAFAVLPAHAETVAWISGRGDSLFALFYVLAALTYAMWRKTGLRWWYGGCIGAFAAALFTKQSGITLLGLLVVYDLLVERRTVRALWSSILVYAPFAGLTVGFLVLRYILFGNAVRENFFTSEIFRSVGVLQGSHLLLLLAGADSAVDEGLTAALGWAVMIVAAGVVLRELRLSSAGESPITRGRAVFFGPAWWLVTTAPLVVTYVSPRHLYLTGVGVAVLLAMAFDALWAKRGAVWRAASLSMGIGLISFFVARLQPAVGEWRIAGDLSRAITRDVVNEAAARPQGSLLLLGAPYTSALAPPVVFAWTFALPFALQPPFVQQDVWGKVSIIGPLSAYCCGVEPWLRDMQQTIEAWSNRTDRPPVVALLWHPRTGTLLRESDAENPGLREEVVRLMALDNAYEACEGFAAIFWRLDPSWEGRFDCAYFAAPFLY